MPEISSVSKKTMATYSAAQRAAHHQQWRASGLSQKAYCQQHQVNLHTFKKWAKQTKHFKQVSVIANPASSVMLSFSNGVKIHLPQGVNPSTMTALIEAVR